MPQEAGPDLLGGLGPGEIPPAGRFGESRANRDGSLGIASLTPVLRRLEKQIPRLAANRGLVPGFGKREVSKTGSGLTGGGTGNQSESESGQPMHSKLPGTVPGVRGRAADKP